jgi:dTDP-4-amino-4,6-dideoxygalactose transaminase
VAAFEREFAAFVGAPFACALSNCTTALHLALRVAGVGPGDEVITVSHSFIATANAVRYCGAMPVFVDVDPETYNMDPARIAAAASPLTKAILVVHQLGMPCDLVAIGAIAKELNVPLVEDAACAAGSEILWNGEWQRIGRPHGDIACFSFHPRKVLTTGDGGMITTANAAWDAKVRLLRQHGMTVPDTARHNATRVVFEEYAELGFNYRLTDLQAAIGRVQLSRLPDMVARRRIAADNYRMLLADIPDLYIPIEPAWARSNWQSFCVRLPLGCDQERVMQAMLDDGISTRRGVMCSHLEPAYRLEPWRSTNENVAELEDEDGIEPGPDEPVCCDALQESEEITGDGLVLPLYDDMTEDDQRRVAASLAAALANEARRLYP